VAAEKQLISLKGKTVYIAIEKDDKNRPFLMQNHPYE